MPSRVFRFRLIAIAGVLLVLLAQAVPYGRHHANPPVVAEPPWDSPATRNLARQACFDCHSNETEWPSYSRVAPVSWLVAHDVEEGRAALNFSEWNRPQKEAAEAANVVRDREMPPWSYRLMHSHARLSDADRDSLASGLATTLGAAKGRNNHR
jgi:mono/diheme cytochrome c family protein